MINILLQRPSNNRLAITLTPNLWIKMSHVTRHVLRHIRATFARLWSSSCCAGVIHALVQCPSPPRAIFLLSSKSSIISLNLTAICHKFHLSPLLLTSRLSSNRLWSRTRTRQRKTSPPILWRPSCSPAILPVLFSPCFGTNYRRLIKLKA